MLETDLHSELIAIVTLGHQNCRYCGKDLESWELAENMKLIDYADKPICFKCASERM